MAVDYAALIHGPGYAVFSRSVTFTPLKSQPGQPAYVGRGIFSTQPIDVPAEGGLVLSDQVTILDILEKEYATLPMQGDRVNIPASGTLPALGDFEVLDRDTNGGGETTLTLRAVAVAKP